MPAGEMYLSERRRNTGENFYVLKRYLSDFLTVLPVAGMTETEWNAK
uniref:Bm4857 n=1 Tax=Brugia malayi TaxID=6279 RepID=A0A1I9GE59_BRUMA|nr:Bm4857 [Brugia malayi]